MLYISREGEIINTSDGMREVLDLYDSWFENQETYKIKTSGSTGSPKLVSLSREAVLASILSTASRFNLNSNDMLLCNLNINSVGGLMMILRSAELGTDLIATLPSANPFEDLGEQCYLFSQNWGKNFFSFVPLQLQNILEKEKHIQLLRTAKAILVGGAPLSQTLSSKVQELNLPVFETYGMTETISHVAVRNVRSNDNFFTVLDGVEIKLNESGCLMVKGPSTLQNWINTNDLAVVESETTFRILGRIDNTINSGGVKIQLETVEQKIGLDNPHLSRFFASGIKDDTLGQKLVLFIEGDTTEINLDSLEKYHKPKEVHFVDKFTETNSGKIDKINTIQNFQIN